jgi:hypothetical protein
LEGGRPYEGEKGLRRGLCAFVRAFVGTTEYIEWQGQLSGVHSILRVLLRDLSFYLPSRTKL